MRARVVVQTLEEIMHNKLIAEIAEGVSDILESSVVGSVRQSNNALDALLDLIRDETVFDVSTAVAGVHWSLANTVQKLTDEVRDLFRRKFRVVDELLKIDTIAHVAHDT